MKREEMERLTLVVVVVVVELEDRVINSYMVHEMRANKQNVGESQAQQVHKLLKATVSNPQVSLRSFTCYQNARITVSMTACPQKGPSP